MNPDEAERSVAGIGEDGILAAIRPVFERLSSSSVVLGNGDDAAVVAAPDARVVISTDLLVEREDFLTSASSGRDVGGKAAGQNLADIAAMGAAPTAIVLGLVVPPTTPVGWLTGFADGLVAGCAPHRVAVVGGDLSAGPVLMVSITVLGDLCGRAPVTRAGARPGDVVALAGTNGFAAAGLAAILADRVDEPVFASGVAIQRSARPPVPAGVAANDAGATAMIDLSDGLHRDAGRIAAASGVLIELDAGSPRLRQLREELAPMATALGDDALAWQWVLGGGEDHGLLACFPADADLPEAFAVIGRVTKGSGVDVKGHGETVADFDHFG